MRWLNISTKLHSRHPHLYATPLLMHYSYSVIVLCSQYYYPSCIVITYDNGQLENSHYVAIIIAFPSPY